MFFLADLPGAIALTIGPAAPAAGRLKKKFLKVVVG